MLLINYLRPPLQMRQVDAIIAMLGLHERPHPERTRERMANAGELTVIKGLTIENCAIAVKVVDFPNFS